MNGCNVNKIKEVEKAMSINNRTFIDYFDRLKLLATSLFTWKNLDEIAGFGASTFLENALFEKGRACFVKDDTKGFLVLNANPSDTLNTYNLPIKIEAWSIAYHKNYDFDDVVYIMNNKMCKPTSDTLTLVAYRLYDIERTIDVNRTAQKTPVLLEGDTKSALTLKNLYMQYSGNTPFIYGNKNFEVNNRINAIKTEAPYLIDKLTVHKHEVWNEALTFLGIDNSNVDKKERLITDEVRSNDELISYYLKCFYETRKQACDMINEKFLKDSDLKIELTLNKELMEELKSYMLPDEKDDIINKDSEAILNG